MRAPTTVAIFFVLAMSSPFAGAQEVRIGVLGLFHPRQLLVTAPAGTALVARAGQTFFIIESTSACRLARIESEGDGILIHCGTKSERLPELSVTSREGAAARFSLTVPGKITRRYRGKLQLTAHSGTLIPTVEMNIETAVASVVAAENPPSTPLEALKAQSVAARSYLLAGKGRHEDFDFCDTTHCQFLREPPPPDSAASIAVLATRGLVLQYRDRVFAPMYTRSCSGRTRTPGEIGLPPAGYPYYSVECKYCREHPSRWETRISAQEALPRASDEHARLELVRRLGWNTIPSDDFIARTDGNDVIIEGVGEGHGVGLCQAGALAMAAAGADFRQILVYYYPNTAVISVPAKSAGRR